MRVVWNGNEDSGMGMRIVNTTCNIILLQEKKQQQEEKLTQHSMRARQVNGVDTASQGEGQKERFIMKR